MSKKITRKAGDVKPPKPPKREPYPPVNTKSCYGCGSMGQLCGCTGSGVRFDY